MVYKYSLPVFLDGFTTQQTVDVSTQMSDARTGIWSLYGLDATEILGALTITDATHVQINITPAPAQGSYFLVGLA